MTVALAPTGFSPSPEQQRVIDHWDGHLQVIGCAGAGKTEAISRRVAALIQEGVEPSQIVAFTFTHRAAEGLKTRISRRVSEVKGTDFLDRLVPMFIGTIALRVTRLWPNTSGCQRLDRAGISLRSNLYLDRNGTTYEQ